MTALTTSAVGTPGKLPAVRIWIVAISTVIMKNRRLEVAPHMTGYALNFEMLLDERITGLRVIECLGELGLLPRQR
jgi:hypothetical protein